MLFKGLKDVEGKFEGILAGLGSGVQEKAFRSPAECLGVSRKGMTTWGETLILLALIPGGVAGGWGNLSHRAKRGKKIKYCSRIQAI